MFGANIETESEVELALTKLSEKLNISNLDPKIDISSAKAKIDFLINMSPDKILDAYANLLNEQTSRGWGPIAWDKHFYKVPAVEYLYESREIDHVPYLIGTTNYDGSLTAALNAPFNHENFHEKVFGLIRLV